MAIRLYERCKNFQESIWGGFKNIPQILEYRYIALENAWTNLILYSNIDNENYLCQLTEYATKDEKYYEAKFFATYENDLSMFDKWNFVEKFDKLFSVKIYVDRTEIVYSDGYNAGEINKLISELENIVYDYLEKHKGLSQDKLKEESKILENMDIC